MKTMIFFDSDHDREPDLRLEITDHSGERKVVIEKYDMAIEIPLAKLKEIVAYAEKYVDD